MKKTFKRAVSLLTVMAILATGVVTALGSLTVSASEVVNEKWTYDFKMNLEDGSTVPSYLDDGTKNSDYWQVDNWFTGSAADSNGHSTNDGINSVAGDNFKQSYVDEEGAHVYSWYGGQNMDHGNVIWYDEAGLAGTKGLRKLMLWDADIAKANERFNTFLAADNRNETYGIFNGTEEDPNFHLFYGNVGGDINERAAIETVKDGLYAVKVTYKVPSMNSGTGRIDIGVGIHNDSANNNAEWGSYRGTYAFEFVNIRSAFNEWRTFTVIVDGSNYIGNGDNAFCITFGNDKYTTGGGLNEIVIGKVEVERYYDATNNEVGVRFSQTTDTTNQNDAADYVLGSAGSTSINMPQYVDGQKITKKWDLYNWYGRTRSSSFLNTAPTTENNNDGVKAANNTLPGATLPASALTTGIYTFRSVQIAGETPAAKTEYSFDMAGMIAAKQNGDGNFSPNGDCADQTISPALDNSMNLDTKGYMNMTGTHGAWFGFDFDNSTNMAIATQKFPFYTGLDTGNAGNFWYNGLKLKAGYTYTVAITYKIDNSVSGSCSTVNMGIGVPIVEGSYWSTYDTNVIEGWRTKTNGTNGDIERGIGVEATSPDADGFVTVTSTFVADGSLDNRHLFILLAANSEPITFKKIKVTQEFIGTYSAYGYEDSTTIPTIDATKTVNGLRPNTSTWYVDPARTIAANGSAFTSTAANVLYAGNDVIYDVASDNGTILTEEVSGDLKMTVVPNSGYTLAAGGLSIVADGNASKVVFKGDAEDKTGEGTGLCFTTKNISVNTISAISAKFVTDGALSQSLVAVSTKDPSGEGATYEGAGIRFRGRVLLNSDVEKVGFVLIPTMLLRGDLTLGSANIITTETAINESVYDESGEYKDFQVLLTNLNKEDGSFDLRNTNITCVMYVVKTDGSVAYSKSTSATYSEIAAMY